VVHAMAAAATAEGVNQTIINVGSGVETTVRDLAQLAIKITGGSPEVVTNPRNESGPARLCADLSKARRLLNYEPQVSLERGLQLTYESDARLQKSEGTNRSGN